LRRGEVKLKSESFFFLRIKQDTQVIKKKK